MPVDNPGESSAGRFRIRKEEEIQESSAYTVSLEPRIWTKSLGEREGGQQQNSGTQKGWKTRRRQKTVPDTVSI